MSNFEEQRNAMIELQLLPRGISDEKVIEAMRKVPRHEFLPPEIRSSAYDDCALPIGEGQTISQPYMVAIMTEKLGLSGGEKVLEIGTGTGYQAAVLAEIVDHVYTIERIPKLAERAKLKFKELGYQNITVEVGDGTEGLEKYSPYDGIIVTAGSSGIPDPLVAQLADGGKLVIPVGDVFSQILTVVTKKGNKIEIQESIGCIFVPLVGKYSWKK